MAIVAISSTAWSDEPKLEPIPLNIPVTGQASTSPASEQPSPFMPAEQQDRVLHASPQETYVIDPPMSGTTAVPPATSQPYAVMSPGSPPVVQGSLVPNQEMIAPPLSTQSNMTPSVMVQGTPNVQANAYVYNPQWGGYMPISVVITPNQAVQAQRIHVVQSMTRYPGGVVYRASSHSVTPGPFEQHVVVDTSQVVPYYVPGQPIRNAIRARRLPER